MIWVMEGKAQSLMQWFILFTTSSGMLEYVLVGKAKGGASSRRSYLFCCLFLRFLAVHEPIALQLRG